MLKTYTQTELQAVIMSHARWLAGEEGGTRADLTRADLTGAVLTDAVLTRAVLTDADLTRADLTDAVLTRAVLTRAVLTDAVLTGAVLTRADLTDAVLTRAVLTGAVGIRAPVVPNIDAAILAAVDGPGAKGSLRMSDWHSCETTHCRAGWAIHLAGEGGYALEDRMGPSAAGALIYAASRPGVPVPNFYASNEDALLDMRRHAAAATGSAS
jgi:uncharacterized protein YjbI with pentapeptide repeats